MTSCRIVRGIKPELDEPDRNFHTLNHRVNKKEPIHETSHPLELSKPQDRTSDDASNCIKEAGRAERLSRAKNPAMSSGRQVGANSQP